jgi:hypothetical protein
LGVEQQSKIAAQGPRGVGIALEGVDAVSDLNALILETHRKFSARPSYIA